MLGHALGVLRLSLSDFCQLSPAEFAQVCRKHRESEEEQERMEWERMRLLAAITIQPHCKKKITPERLLPLPWDRGKGARSKVQGARIESSRERMMEVYRRSKEKK